MSDPVGLIGATGGSGAGPAPRSGGAGSGTAFKEVLLDNLRQVNEMQIEANRAIEDLASGSRDDVEGVAMATQKADAAFKMLQAVRNKVMEAYEEIKSMRT
ncbi:MAG: flagellar hook-basal body complex protein FliE [Phycisphaeraceae bacterium]|nr:flagellar hook-basal body complex protein FliE [Phycisphaeraceae bacterium]